MPPFFGPRDLEAWDQKELRKLQLKDPWCGPLMRRLQSQSAPEVEKDRFELRQDGVLCIRALVYPSQTAKIVVPDCLKAFILRRHHGIPKWSEKGAS